MDTLLVSPVALREMMRRRGFSVRKLADAVEARLIRDFREGDPKPTCSKSTISNLCSGSSRVCRADRAAAIESILGIEDFKMFRPVIRADKWFIEHTRREVA
ncbi:hypothetical protein K8O93_00635 [Gordonia bronchialis]|uniref:helix-turn-helix domain-containing protein n=1 Tax=Gordonia bronchialis TaxID=2054 RepID=UPI001CBD161D|nr:helix-turn-helix domain-containing protein [Gordonia bronchialis]UAK38340.1 hypothetical protein K8O93_00635 [Gordonia bronchialis]